MLFRKLLWFFYSAVVIFGVTVRAFILTAIQDEVRVNLGQNVSLQWTYDVAQGDDYDVLWGTTDGNLNIEDILFSKNEREATPQPSPRMPARYAGRVQIINKATLFIKRVALLDENSYLCELKGQFVTVRRNIKLIVIVPPQIVTQLPPNVKWNDGESQRITCEATGKPRPLVSWMKNGSAVIQAKKKAELAFPLVVPEDAGEYTCVAENAGGRREKRITVDVLYSPKDTTITTDAPGNIVSDGSMFTITCKARGNPPPKYKFFLNGIAINDRSAERTGKYVQSGMIYHGNKPSGVYSCVPENDKGSGPKKEVTVYVRHSPTIDSPPGDAYVDEKNPVDLECKARGYPPPAIKWIKLHGSKEVGQGSSFFIPSVQRSDQGQYKCIATNGYGDDATAEFEIQVIYSPVINKTASSQRVPAFPGHKAKLTCIADGNPRPRYVWSNSSGKIATSESEGTLVVTPQDKHSFGPYTCTALNDKGKDRLEITLVKVGEPEVKLRTRVISTNSIDFFWELSSGGRNPLQHYILQYRTEDSSEWIDKIQISPENMSYQLTNLLPYTTYIAELYATNEYFTGPPSRVIRRTLEAAPGPPRDIVVYAVNGTTIRVQWRAPVRPNGAITRYTVLYDPTKEFVASLSRKISVMPNVTEAHIRGLEPFTNYTVQVQVWNSVDKNNSSAVMVHTKPSAPSKPGDFEANTTGPHSARLRWRKPKKPNGKIVVFQIWMRWRYHNAKGKEENTSIEIPARLTAKSSRTRRRFVREASDYVVWRLKYFREVELKKVQPFAVISMRVREGTKDISGTILWSEFSNNQTIKTLEGAPSEPLMVKITDSTTSSLKVTWRPPRYPNGIIQKYRILYSNNTGKNYTVNISTGLKNATLFYTIYGLKKYTNYKVYVQAFTNFSGKASLPVQGNAGSEGTTLARDGVDTGSLYGGVFAGIILLAFAIIIVALIIRNRRKRRDSTELKSNRYAVANSNDSGIGDKESLDRVPGIKYLQGSRRGSEEIHFGQIPCALGGKGRRNSEAWRRALSSDVVGPGKFVTVKPIPVEKLRDYCEINHADANKSFREEFVSIRVPGNFTWEHSQKPENKAKNRYQNIIPYDHTRVTLAEVEGFPGTDYINANFLDGYNHHYKFIATQGPVANTFGDFWRMVWDQGVCVIVMVTNIVERGRIKCLKYWPSSSPDMYGPILVSPVEEEELADYVVRKFSIQMTSNTSEFRAREVTQFHFTAWPDHGVPTHATSLLAFLRKVRAFVPEDSGPILTHCSAGVGRSGTYIVLDAMLDQIAAEGVLDIYGFVCHIRQQRSSMVQTEAQYIFIHDALMEYVTCGNTEFNVRELPEKLRVLNTVDPDSGDTLLVGEFKNLGIGDSDTDSFVCASLPENKAKNRFAILPFDRTRVKLWPYTGVVGSDYINGSFVDSFQQREAFIATQAPLENTVVDFWRMTWEYEAYSIVMLSSPRENEEGQCAQYLPLREEFIVFGLLMIEVESEEEKNGFCKRHLKLTNTKSGEVRNVYHFHFLDWAERSIPLNGAGLLEMMRTITRVQQQTCNGPVIVHCSDGSGRTGAFCAISIALERVKLDGTIDMFQNVRRLRTQRPLMVQTADQYNFCYDMVRLFVDSYGDYANFK